jgi:hypothetical protein
MPPRAQIAKRGVKSNVAGPRMGQEACPPAIAMRRCDALRERLCRFPRRASVEVTERSADRDSWPENVVETELWRGIDGNVGDRAVGSDRRRIRPKQEVYRGAAVARGRRRVHIHRRHVWNRLLGPEVQTEKSIGAHDELPGCAEPCNGGLGVCRFDHCEGRERDSNCEGFSQPVGKALSGERLRLYRWFSPLGQVAGPQPILPPRI